MSEEELNAAEAVEEGIKAEPCIRCGFSIDHEPLPLEEDMEEYLRCILGGLSFMKEYSLYNGKIQLTFRSINNREVDQLNDILFRIADHMDTQEVQDRGIKLKLMYFLAKVKLSDRDEEYDIPTLTEFAQIPEEFNKRFGDCAEPIIRLMSQSLLLFMDLQGLLVSQGFDENFWKGAGLRSR